MSRINSIDFKTVFEFILFVRIYVVFFFSIKPALDVHFRFRDHVIDFFDRICFSFEVFYSQSIYGETTLLIIISIELQGFIL